MNIISRYRFSLTAISLVVCPLVVSLVVLPEVIFGAEVQDSRSDLVVAQATGDRKAEADRLLDKGGQLYRASRYQEALQAWEQSLQIYRIVKDLKGEGTSLNNIGETYRLLGQYQKAIDNLQKALAIARQINDLNGTGNALNNLGSTYALLGQYPQAIEIYQQSLLVTRQIGDRKVEGYLLNNLGNIYKSLGQYPKAIDYYQQSLNIFKQLNDRFSERALLNNLGFTYNLLGQYPKAIAYSQQSLAIAKQIGDRNGEGGSLSNLGNAYQNLGQYQKSIDSFQQAFSVFKQVGNRSDEISSLTGLGSTYNLMGQYQKAIDYHTQSLTVAREIEQRNSEGKALGNLGNVYSNLGQYQKAIDFYQQSLVIVKQLGDRNSEGISLDNIGNTYYSLGQYQKAIDYHLQSLAIAKQLGDIRGQGISLNRIGNVYNALGQYQKAIEYSLQSLTIARQIGNLDSEGTTLNNLGVTYGSIKEYQKAIEYNQQSLTIARQIGDRNGEGFSLNNLGISFFRSNNLIAAEQTLRAGIEVWESLRANSGSDTNKVSIFESQTRTYRALQQVLVAQKQPNNALEIAERGRARALVELLNSNLQRNESTSQPKLLPPNITSIQQVAKARQANLVEYSIIYDDFNVNGKQEPKESELYIWVISPNGQITFRSIDLKPIWQKQNTSLSELVENSRKGIGVSDRDATIKIVLNPEYRQQLRQEQSKYLRQLHQILIEPIADLLPADPNARVVFMPQSALYLVPFAALQDKSEQYLIQKHTIAISPSIQVLSLTQQQRLALPNASARSSQNILIAGNPVMPKVFVPGIDQPLRLDDLQGAKQEAIAVANTLKTTALTGNQATKKAVVQQMQSARIIHLATHGLLDDFKGMGVPGAIALAPDGNGSNNDGLLTADEILGMKLKAELVVLSACNTGRGKITGDGVIGLSRSLISAGVPSIIVSLWSVPDAPTAELMSDFYTLLEQNPDKAQALRQAMLKTMKTHPDPRDWAAFTLIGES